MNLKMIGHTISFFQDKKNKNLILGVCAAIILIIVIPLFDGEKGKVTPTKENEGISTQQYNTQLTEQLEFIITQMDGVGKVEILLAMENGVENIYVDEEKINQTGEAAGITLKENSMTALQRERQVLVIRDNDGGENPVLVKQLEPKVSGVLVVCDGGDRESVKYQVTNAIKALLDVPSNRIHVMKRKT